VRARNKVGPGAFFRQIRRAGSDDVAPYRCFLWCTCWPSLGCPDFFLRVCRFQLVERNRFQEHCVALERLDFAGLIQPNETAMERDDRSAAQPDAAETKRNEALARYDAHPGIAVIVLALGAFLFIAITYQFASDRTNHADFSSRNVQAVRTQNPLIGLRVLSSDGQRIGTVNEVDGEPNGKITAINVVTGGFLGLGGKLVAIHEGKFKKIGDSVRLSVTADEVSKLPERKAQ